MSDSIFYVGSDEWREENREFYTMTPEEVFHFHMENNKLAASEERLRLIDEVIKPLVEALKLSLKIVEKKQCSLSGTFTYPEETEAYEKTFIALETARKEMGK